MARKETLQKVTRIFREGEKINGCTDAQWVANEICAQTGFGDPSRLVWETQRMRSHSDLYPAAYDTVRDLVMSGDVVRVWTQGHETGQLYKLAGTGLGKVRRELGRENRNRFGVYVSREKVENLKDPISELVGQGINRVVIVDDKAENILGLRDRVKKLKDAGEVPDEMDIRIVWSRQGKYRDRVPEGWTPEGLAEQFPAIEDIAELSKLKNDGGENKTGWLIDLDHTLLDTSRYHEILYAQQAMILDGLDVHLDARTAHTTGLAGDIKEVQPLVSGMSGGKVAKVVRNSGPTVVLKTNKKKPQKVGAENEAYMQLQQSPLADYLLYPVSYHPDQAALVLPYFPGKELRKSLRERQIKIGNALQVSAELLDIKKRWWSSQQKLPVEGDYKSMQRKEWEETNARLGRVLDQVAAHFDMPVDNLVSKPIIYAGQMLPSIQEFLSHVSDHLGKDPGYLVRVHGDATGANILINPENGVWKLIDTEWSGPADPAESMVRIVKQESTTTATGDGQAVIVNDRDAVSIYSGFGFHPDTTALHYQGLESVPGFANALNDPGFEARFYSYLTGSYVRELALSGDRGGVPASVFSIILASRAMSEVNRLNESRAA